MIRSATFRQFWSGLVTCSFLPAIMFSAEYLLMAMGLIKYHYGYKGDDMYPSLNAFEMRFIAGYLVSNLFVCVHFTN